MIERICHARIVLPDREVANGELKFSSGKVASVSGESLRNPPIAAQTGETADFDGDFLLPGLIDLHVHGCEGSDVMDGSSQALSLMASALLRKGTAAFLPTTMTAPMARLTVIAKIVGQWVQTDKQAEILGIHCEGPCINAAFKGAQKIAAGAVEPVSIPQVVKIITLAPELPQAAAWIDQARDSDVILSAGHSGATYDQMLVAMDSGVRRLTHAFNAMPGIHHRSPGLLTAALLDARVSLELIADGVHIHPAVLELALRIKGVDRVSLVSDGTRATGMPDGEYDLGGQQVRLRQGRMLLPDGTIAGSAVTLLEGVRFMAEKVGRPLHEAVRMASLVPARLLGLDSRLGSLLPGREATFLRLGQDLNLKEVWVKGRRIY